MKKYTFNPQPIYQGPSTTWNGAAWETKQIISISHSFHDAFVEEEGKVITDLFYQTEYNTLEDAQRDFDRMIEIDKLNASIEKLKSQLSGIIDYHHHIGNDDCPYSHNQIMTTLYNLALTK